MQFKEIIGQEEIIRQLVHGVEGGRISHAQLLVGGEGVGALPLAIAYAQYLNCTDRHDGDSCGVCPSCRQLAQLAHPDVHFVFPVNTPKGKSGGEKPISDTYMAVWRKFVIQTGGYFNEPMWYSALEIDNKQGNISTFEADEIIRKLSFKAFESEYKVVIIWLPERMNAECANKLLKLLEEPSPHTYFFFVSNEPTKLLPTVVSRMRRIAMHVLPVDVISEALQHRYGVSEADARAVAALSGGSYLHACEALSLNEETDAYFDLFVKVMRLAYARRIKDLKEWSEEVAGFGRERIRHFLSYAERMIRENYIYNLASPDLNYMSVKERQFSSRFAPFINERNVLDIRKLLEDANNDIAQNANAKIVMFDFCINLILLLKK